MKRFAYLIQLVGFLLVASCAVEQQGAHQVFVDPVLAAPQVGWYGGGDPWTSVDSDAALLIFPLAGLVPEGATIVGYEIRWYQSQKSSGLLTAVLERDHIHGPPEKASEHMAIGQLGATTVDSATGLEAPVMPGDGYRLVVETSGSDQVCRVYGVLVWYRD